MNKSTLIILTLSLSLFTFTNAQETKVEDNGKALAKKHCAECHGEVGNSVADKTGVVPNIAGFSAILLFDTLYQFKYKDRESLSYKDKNNKLMDMGAVSKNLTEDEAQAIALYYAQQTFSPVRKQGNKPLAAQGKQLHLDLCNDCHGKLGTSAIDDAPILSGQRKPYLVRQFEHMSEHKRYMPRRMKQKFRKLNAQDKLALIEFYTTKVD